MPIALVVGMHHHRGVAEHRLGPRGGHDDLARAVGERIADVPEEAVFLLAHHLEVGHRGLEHRVPADHALAAIDEAFLVEPHEGVGDDLGQLVVHGEVLVAPAHARAEPAHLVRDRGAAHVLPFPHFRGEFLAADAELDAFVARLAPLVPSPAAPAGFIHLGDAIAALIVRTLPRQQRGPLQRDRGRQHQAGILHGPPPELQSSGRPLRRQRPKRT